MYQNPILLIGFNRPDIIQSVIKRIEEIKPSKLYVALDGPRKNIVGEALKCQAVLAAVNNISWPGEVKYKVRDTNAGCKINVTEAISWVLSENDDVVILEDDIVPSVVFFNYVSLLLEKYRYDNRVAMISANQYTPVEQNSDYLFTKYGHIWGWATWKRVWDSFDVNVPELKDSIGNKFVNIDFVSSAERTYFLNYFAFWHEKILNKKENAWGPQFFYYRVSNNLLSIAPKVNLASNIGAVSSRTDVRSYLDDNYYESNEYYFVQNHPERVCIDKQYEQYHFSKHISNKTKLLKRIFRKIRNLLNK
jgi:hypothetical protein